jgi:hypothetical protein
MGWGGKELGRDTFVRGSDGCGCRAGEAYIDPRTKKSGLYGDEEDIENLTTALWK